MPSDYEIQKLKDEFDEFVRERLKEPSVSHGGLFDHDGIKKQNTKSLPRSEILPHFLLGRDLTQELLDAMHSYCADRSELVSEPKWEIMKGGG